MTRPRRYWALLVMSVVISTTVVAMAFNPIPHTGGDNAGYVALGHGLLTTGSYTDVFDPEGLPHTKYPPFFPFVLSVLLLAGARTWVALKLSAAVSTVAAVALTYLWTERSLGDVGAFGLAVLLAFSSGIVYYSHWILSDPVFLALTLAALFALARADEEEAPAYWLPVGVSAAALAYLTRSAGLPLVLALLVWLALRRRWRALGASATGLGIPMLLWWLRGRGQGVAQYGTEFWLVNPYQPELGRVGFVGLASRVVENLGAYVFEHAPQGIVGADLPGLPVLGVLLALAGLAGWILTLRERVGPAELFLPFYAGLILVWPVIWGGDRFFLPLYPLLFLYGAKVVNVAVGRLPTVAAAATTAVVFVALLVPASIEWLGSVREASACSRIAAERGVWACYPARVQYYVAAAEWSGSALPPRSAVLTRKPRHFYLFSGLPSRTFPFSQDPAHHLALGDSIGARYLLFDRWDQLASRYVGAAIGADGGAFCYVGAVGEPADGGSQLFAMVRPEHRTEPTFTEEGNVQIGACPPGYSDPNAEVGGNYSSSGRIPLLDGLDS